MNLPSVVASVRRKVLARAQARVPARKRPSRLRIEELERREVPAVLPAPIVDQTSHRSIDNTAWAPVIAADPTNPNILFAAFVTPGGNGTRIAVRYSTDAGVTWADRLVFADPILGGNRPEIPNNADPVHTPPPVIPFEDVTDPSITWDRFGNVYLAYTEHHSPGDQAGNIVLRKFTFRDPAAVGRPVPGDMNPAAPGTQSAAILYSWFNGTRAYNVNVAVDSNLATFVDPDSGVTQVDPLAGAQASPPPGPTTMPSGNTRIFVTWNTDVRDAGNATPANMNPNVILAKYSDDGGATWSTNLNLSDNRYDPAFGPFVQSKTVFTPGRAGETNSGGRMANLFTSNRGGPGNTPTILADTHVFTAAAVPHVHNVSGGGTIIDIDNDAPDTTDFQLVFPAGTGITRIDNIGITVNVSFLNNDLSHLRAVLIAPNGAQHILWLNRTDAAGNDAPDGRGLDGTLITNATLTDSAFFAINQGEEPYSGDWLAEGSAPPLSGFPPMMTTFGGLNPQGTWILRVTDMRDDGDLGTIQATLRVGQGMVNNGVADRGTGATEPGNPPVGPAQANIRGQDHPNKPTFSPQFGVGPGLTVAVDNTLGSFSPYQNRVYMAYSTGNLIRLMYSDDGGVLWNQNPVPVGQGYLPHLTVDPTTGTLLLAYYTSRFDAANARSTVVLQTSVNGAEFKDRFGTIELSPAAFVTPKEQAFDQIRSKVVDIEPVPSNGPAAAAATFNEMWGNNMGLFAYGGRVNLVHAGNLNIAGSTLRTQNIQIGAGPRIVRGDMGPILGESSVPGVSGPVTYNNTVTTDGRDPFTGFVVEFDRVIQPSSFTIGEVKVVFHAPTDDPALPGTPVNVTNIIALDNITDPIDGSAYGSKRFLVRVDPQTAVGTYSYSIGANANGDTSGIRDRIRSQGLTFLPSGTQLTRDDTPPQPVTIVDFAAFPTPLVRTIAVLPADFPAGTVVGNVQVRVNITHANVSDLRMELIAPNGQIITLVNELEAAATNDYPNTTFSDAGADTILNSAPPYTGVYRPVRPFNDLHASQITGNWQLRVTDLAAADQGELVSWGLILDGVVAGQGTVENNFIDQDADGRENEAAFLAGGDLHSQDTFAVPNPTTDVPFKLPYTVGSLPIVIPGPRLIASRVAGQQPSSDNLVKDTTARNIDVEFDRTILATSFTSSDILRITGPLGDVPLAGVTVTPITALNGTLTTGNSRFFRITFAEQRLSGTYNIQISSQIQDTDGNNLLDTNTNAGVGNLTGTVTDADVQLKFYPSQVVNPLTIPAKGSVTANLNIGESYQVKRALVHMKISNLDPLNPLHTRNLEGRLVAPDGTTVLLFSNSPRTGDDTLGFSNTVFDDAALTAVQEGGSGYDGSFNPQQPLAQVIDHGSRGIWKLVITNSGNETGTLDQFALSFDKPVVGTGLGEEIGDRTTVALRIQQTDGSTVVAKGNWAPVGPAPHIYNGSVNSSAGRIGAVAVDPSDPSGNTVYAAGASGGVWRTNNFLTRDISGPTWVPLTDFGPNNAINVGSLAVYNTTGDPNSTVIIVGTGSDDLNEIAISEFRRSAGDPNANREQQHRFDGVGFLLSENGGQTWQVLDSTNNYDPASNTYRPFGDGARDHLFVGAVVNRLVVEPLPDRFSQRPIIYAAVGRGALTGAAADATAGLWRSRDGGRTWTKILVSDQTGPVVNGDVNDFLFGQGSQLFNSDGRPSFAYVAIRGAGVFFTSNLDSPEPAFELMDRAAGRPFLNDSTIPGPVPVNDPTETPNGQKGRIVLASPSLVPGDTLANNYYQRWLYAAVANEDGTFDGLYMTKDRGYNWTKVKLTQGGGFNDSLIDIDPTFHDEVTPSNRFAGGNHSLTLAVDPNDPNIVYLGSDSLIKVDTTLVDDPYNITMYSGSQPDGGAERPNTVGAVVANTPVTQAVGNGLNAFDPARRVSSLTPSTGNYNASLTAAVRRRWNHLNSDRDPYNPFVVDTTLTSSNLANFTNTGGDVRWVLSGGGASAMPEGDYNWVSQILTIRDPLTGLGRLIFGHDEGITSYVPTPNASPNEPTGAMNQVNGFRQDFQIQDSTALRTDFQITGRRNGNIQVARLYSGDSQPSLLASQISGSLLYGAARRLGDIQVSVDDVLGSGGLTWGDDGRNPPFLPEGGRANYVAADQLGKGKIYILRRVNDLPFEGEFRTDFFQISDNGNAPISRTNGLFQSPTDPQWTNRVRVFAVNTALRTANDVPALILGSDVGRLFRSRDDGRNWNAIAEPGRLDNSYLTAMAFGGPELNSTNPDDHIIVGSENGNVFVTTVGGGNLPTSWTNLTGGTFGSLDGSDIMKIVPNPQRGTHEMFVVTQQGVYHMPDWTAPGAVWVDLTANLKTISATGYGNAAWTVPVLSSFEPIATLAVDWRATYGSQIGQPILYVGGDGGVFRAVANADATIWSRYTGAAQASSSDGGGLPVAKVTDLDLVLGNIDPNTGRVIPAASPDMLVATTLGRGSWSNSIDVPEGTIGPRVIESTIQGLPPGPQFDDVSWVTVKFDQYITPDSFTLADVVILGPNGQTIPVTAVTDITTPSGNSPNLHTDWRIDFAPLSADGTYTVVVGPFIRSGNVNMDQDADATPGEVGQDEFRLQVVVGKNDLTDFVRDVYTRLLNRVPTTADMQAKQVTDMINARITGMGVVIKELLSTHPTGTSNPSEARQRLVERLFDNGNAAGEIGHLLPTYTLPIQERDFYVNALKKGTRTPEMILIDIIATTDATKGFKDAYYNASNLPGAPTPTSFVTKLYADLFKGTGIQLSWIPVATRNAQITQAGTPNGRLNLVKSLVNGAVNGVKYHPNGDTNQPLASIDFRSHLTRLAYNKFLGRDPQGAPNVSGTEFNSSRALLAKPLAANSIQGSEWLYWKILASQEYFNLQTQDETPDLPDDGLHTNRSWVDAVIEDRMFRDSTDAERDAFSQKVLDRFEVQRKNFVNSIVLSAVGVGIEWRTDQITDYFQSAHARNPSDTELTTELNALKNGSTLQTRTAVRFASSEFFSTNAPVFAGSAPSTDTWAKAVVRRLWNLPTVPTSSDPRVSGLKSRAGNASTVSTRQTAMNWLLNSAGTVAGVDYRGEVVIPEVFQLLLGVDPSANELTAYKNFLKTRRWETLYADILANGAAVIPGSPPTPIGAALPRTFWEEVN
jgi:subtilisin-like proprotein convertase family protein